MSKCKHDDVVPGRKPGTERCRDCSWVYPCRGNDCGHLDCIEFRQELPLCHYCRKRVQGPAAGIRRPISTFAPIRDFGGEDASWTPWSVRGITRAVHYVCRDAVDAGTMLEQDGSEQAENSQEAVT